MLTDRAAFGSTLLGLSLALKMYGRELTPEMQRVYWLALQDLTDAEFQAAAMHLAKTCTDFPTPSQFLDVIHPAVAKDAAAYAVMCAALLCTDYNPEDGSTWRRATIRAKISPAAEEAFIACGGAASFRLVDSEFHGPKIRAAFCDTYTALVTRDPKSALPEPQLPLLQADTMEALTAGIGDLPRLTAGREPPAAAHNPAAPATPEELEARRRAWKTGLNAQRLDPS